MSLPCCGMTGLGADPFPYKEVSCADLDHRIGRLKANKRFKEPAYQKNFKLFSEEYAARCSMAPGTTPSAMNYPVATAQPNPLVTGLIATGTSIGGNLLKQWVNPDGSVTMTPVQNVPPEQPFYETTWFKVAAVAGAIVIGIGIWKMSKRG